MRITRCQKKKKKQKIVLVKVLVFFIIIPITAFIISSGIIKLVTNENTDKNTNENNSLSTDNEMIARHTKVFENFENIFNIQEKSIYRVDIKSFKDYSEAISLIEYMKSKTLNAFIVKQDGYTVIYGIFNDLQIAKYTCTTLETHGVNSTINEINYLSLNVNPDNISEDIIKSIRNINQTIQNIIDFKFDLTSNMLKDNTKIFTEQLSKIYEEENRLAYQIQQLANENNKDELLTKYRVFVYEILNYKLGKNKQLDYYSIQNSLLNQLEAINRLLQTISI